MNAIFQCLAEETSSLRSSPKEQVLAWLNVTTQYRRKGSKSGTQVRHAVKAELSHLLITHKLHMTS